ncbi:MAG: hypothetical protein A2Y77_17025 [Planctomycetes bacterium RBG_13_62_9]|nr:MAG: hypothetical protein A2Y77_17025 [Planctomycetes bacterium RBG_13_62_9]
MEVAKAYVRDGNEPAAVKAVNDLISRFADQPSLPTQIVFVGDTYAQAKKYDQANQLYKHVCDHWPKDEQTLWAKTGQARVCIAKCDDEAAEGILHKMVMDYASHPRLAEAVNLIALGCYERARSHQGAGQSTCGDGYRQALKVWAIVMRDLPPSLDVAQACYHSGVVYDQELQEHEQALQCYQRVAESWPDYEHAWHAWFSVGQYYEKLKREGAISRDEADAQIAKAYRTVTERYPDCRYAGYAALRLGQLLYEQGQWVEAAKSLERFLEERASGDLDQKLGVLFHLSVLYDRMGEKDAAEQVRRQFREAARPDDPRLGLLDGRATIEEREVRK